MHRPLKYTAVSCTLL